MEELRGSKKKTPQKPQQPERATETQSVGDYIVGRYGNISNTIPTLLYAILCEIVEVKRCLDRK